ncbi:hypothetical protein PLESTM_001238200 [Pleodorina starrii]|nr:hypothetical protein PLESTM_001238200 [Pleodorina starrii]
MDRNRSPTRPRSNGNPQSSAGKATGSKLPPLRGGSAGNGAGSPSVLQQAGGGAQPPLVSADHRPGTLPPITSPHTPSQHPRLPSPPREQASAPELSQNSLVAIMAIIEPEFRYRIFKGTDVIEYYARYGHDAKVKMFHCVKAHPHGTGSPYDLAVVAKEALPAPRPGNSYYTMSASGVVQVFADGSPAEYTPIGEWVRETSVYNMMKQLSFFRNYMSQRYLRIWRGSARSSHFERLRTRMESRMLLAKPDFCFTIMDVGAKVFAMQQVDLVEMPREGPVALSEFLAMQEEQRKNKATYQLGNLLVAVERSLQRLIGDVRKNAEWLTKEVAELERETNPVLAAAHPTGNKPGRSILKAKTEKLEKSKALRQAQQEVSLLVNMVRLADYMCCEGSLKLLLRTVEGLRDTFESKSILLTQVSFGTDGADLPASLTDAVAAASGGGGGGGEAGLSGGASGGLAAALGVGVEGEASGGIGGAAAQGSVVSFHASEDEVRMALTTDLVDALNEVVKQLPRLPQQDSLKPLFVAEAVANSSGTGAGHLSRIGPEMITMLMGYRPLQKARLGLGQVVSKAFREARAAASRYAGLRVVAAFAAAFDAAAYRCQERDVAQFRRDMALLRSWMDDLVAFKAGYDGVLLHLSVSEMQDMLSATLEEAMVCLRILLTAAAHNASLAALDDFQGLTTNLSGRPQKLDDFAAYYSSFSHVISHRESIERRYAIVISMYEMLTEYGGKVPPADQVTLDDLKEVVGGFHRALGEAATWVDERKPAMVHALAKAIRDVVDRLQELFHELRSGEYDNVDAAPGSILEQLSSATGAFTIIQEKAARYRGYEELFGQQPSRGLDDVEQANKELSAARGKWQALSEFAACKEGWMTSPCAELDPEAIQAKVDELARNNYKALKARKEDPVSGRLKSQLEEFSSVLPLLQEVANKALEKRHWEQIFAALGRPSAESFTVRDLLDWDILTHIEAVSNIGGVATKEASMLKTLDKMETEWNGLDFRVLPYKDTGAFILGGTDEIQTVLDDQIVKIQAMNASPFVKPFKERASAWEATLQNLQDMLDNWLKCQATWLYLEPIFSSDDIVKQMPGEGDKFRQVDAMWRRMMKNAHHAPAVIPIARERERLERLVEANELLDAIQRGLAAYLEKKRLFFPRFFFLSNDEMLEILSETKDPTRVQPHLKKCFEGISSLTFTPQLVITAMNSVEKESVAFKNAIDTNKARGAVERWLLEVEEAMFSSIHDVTGRGLADYATRPRDEWVLQWPGMVVLVVTAIFWTSGVEKALKDGGDSLREYESQCTSDLLKIVDLVRGELTNLQRATLGALVVMDVHARDVVSSMVAKRVVAASDFEWQAQLRSYWEENEAALAYGGDSSGRSGPTVMMRMMSACLEYGYEYLGNSSRLVITPLTDRCYRTLMGAIHLTLGGAPEGPAGTGKTETTKDLAKALARQCVVFNCSDSLDYQAMGKFFKGLASSGAWACFDEFNRIDLEVLSVVAQQVLDIQRAIHARLRRFTFEGTEMQLKWSAWCSITMNPGYAGRSELPDNLKALFRTVAMMVPDYAMISEIILYSNGYLKARDCAKKIVQCYKLCSEQLSSQDHYDYGMRAVMAVLRAAGNLKRRFPSEDEYVLMLRSIIDVNLCKFLSHDVPLFNGIISDLFPGVVLPKPDYGHMESALKEACAARNLQPSEYFLLKSIQLYEMIVVRHGLMIVGLPFAGKTSSYRVLADALTIMEEKGQEGQTKAEYHVINPKSITMGQLYGQFDPVSHEWTDGVLAVMFRQVASNPEPHRKWLVLDGPVDAIWIENMNTVLDDNKKLCLNSGEIIQMSASMNMIFEVMDLAVASPATVSRCGMVYLEPHQLGWRPLVQSWIASLPSFLGDVHRVHLLALFDWLLPVSLRFLRRELKESAPTLDANLVTTLMRYMTASMDHLQDEAQYTKMSETSVTQHLEALFVFALVWSVGGSGADNTARQHFDTFIRAAVGEKLYSYASPSGEKYTQPEDIPPGHTRLRAAQMMPLTVSGVDPPPGGHFTVYDFFFDTDCDSWRLWTELIDTTPIPSDAKFRRIIIPSIDTVRYTYLLDKGVAHAQPVLIVGPTGTGKSVLVQKYLYGLPPSTYVPPNVIGFSARTSANSTQHLIDAKLDRRRRGVFGPPVGKKMVVFVDDLNMPQLETYGAQPPIELLRQFMDHGGWYDRQNTFRRLDDVLFVAAMGPPGGGRNPITPRYGRHFNLVSIVDFDEPTLGRIFSTLLAWHLDVKEFPEFIKDPSGSGKMIEDYWGSAQKLLADPMFVKTLKEYDKDAVPPKIIERIRREFTSNPEFTPGNAAKASSAAEGLCKWVCAMDQYDKVAKVVAPKRAALAVAEAEYNKVMEALKAKQADLAEVMGRLATLERQLDKSIAEKARLEAETELCTAKLERAEKLISGLGGEKTRWTEAAAKMGGQYECLTGDMLIAAGVIGYLGAFTASYRESAVGKWVEACAAARIPRSPSFGLAAALGDPVKIRSWTIDGLPNDAFSIDNAIMVDNARRWPLMIDPQSQANKWVKHMEGRRDLRVIKLTDSDYMRTLENAVQFGLPVLLENVGEELDPSLEPLLLKQVFKQGGLSYLRLGDTTVEFSDQFKFYITTSLRNPHYLPETAVKVTLLNFMITPDGLADQLLGVVVAQERPDLEEQRQQLVVESAENKKKLAEIEDRILQVLSSSQGNILEDATAIQILSEAKAVSNEISLKQEASELTQRAIDTARTAYAPCGTFNATLFFCIRDMAAVDPMYQYSLAWFLKLFVRSIQQAAKVDDVAERLHNINDHFTYALYQNICRSLFEKDKLLFAFLLSVRILLSRSEGRLEPHLYQFLLTGGVGVPERDVQRPEGADWLSAKAWGELLRAPNVCPAFEGLPEVIAGCPDEWRALFDSVEPQSMELPMSYDYRLEPFQKVLLLRMLRPDKVVPAVQSFVASSLGARFTEPPPFDLAGSYEESGPTVPLLFVLSPGSDPTAALLQFAEARGYGAKISVISMGQGQGPKAAALIEAARKAGTWVLLQNCHLAPSWMTSLEKICETIRPDNTDPDFRLWMTSMPSPAFPVSILQGSVKMTNEPPAGLRANLRRSYALEPICNQEFFEVCRQPRAFKALLFGLCFLHAFVQERRKFGPIGWNIPYGFDDGDLRISVRQLSMYLDDAAPPRPPSRPPSPGPDGSSPPAPQLSASTVPFAALQYAIGECNYGGRVTDDKDRRLLLTALQRIYRPEALGLESDQPFQLSASGTYYIPPEGPHASYLSYISTLPIFPLPEAFGLHENADITKDLQQTSLMLDTLVLTGGGGGGGAGAGGGGGGGGSEEDVVAAMVEDILKRLPPNFDVEKAQAKYPVRYEESLNQVLCQEMLRYNRLLAIIRTSLISLGKALSGLQVLSSELDTVLRSMALGQVPALWKGKSFPSLKPLASYTSDLLARLEMLQSWYDNGPPPVFWLSGFFFTPSFTTAALQNYARKHKLPIDIVGFDFVMMGTDPSAYETPPEDGVYVHGLFLEGCGWDPLAHRLCESRPKVLFENAPVIWLQPRPTDQFSEEPHYECPVYRTAERKGVLATTGHSTNFLMMIKMPSQLPQWHWTMRGVCMLASLSD